MSRIVTDANGAYDLAHVTSITTIPQTKRLSQTETTTAPALAKLHYPGGTAHSTLLPFKEILQQWANVKAAESHPVDAESGAPDNPVHLERPS